MQTNCTTAISVCEPSEPSPMPAIVRTIPLTRGKVALVDAADYELVVPFKWCALQAKHTCYAVRHESIAGRPHLRTRRRMIYMHRFILDTLPGLEVDHWDHNGLNNCRSNIRVCTRRENQANKRFSVIRSSSTATYRDREWYRNKEKCGPQASRVCEQCGTHFAIAIRQVRRGRGRFCTLSCSNRYRAQHKPLK